jgi:hypothetical protein
MVILSYCLVAGKKHTYMYSNDSKEGEGKGGWRSRECRDGLVGSLFYIMWEWRRPFRQGDCGAGIEGSESAGVVGFCGKSEPRRGRASAKALWEVRQRGGEH